TVATRAEIDQGPSALSSCRKASAGGPASPAPVAAGHDERMTFSLPDFETLRVAEIDDDIALVTLTRPDRLNAITSTMISELSSVVEAVDLDPRLRAVILTGEGRGFSAGLDLQSQGRAPGADD